MGWLAGALQGIGAVGLALGLFVILPWGLALAIVSVLAIAGGTALEVGRRPRVVPHLERVPPERLGVGSWNHGPRPSDVSGR